MSFYITKTKGSNLDVNETHAQPYWTEPKQGSKGAHDISFLFDPFASNKVAMTLHSHKHTSWAENIFDTYIAGLTGYHFQSAKELEVYHKNKPVLIVGRGKSARDNADIINSRSIPAVFLNTAYLDFEHRPGDCVCITDNDILTIKGFKPSKNLNLISHPGIDGKVKTGWNRLYGVKFFTNNPLNNWMRKLFKDLPPVCDQLSVSLVATHLVVLNGASKVIYIGADYCNDDDKESDQHPLQFINEKSESYFTSRTYMEMSNALTALCYFCNVHAKSKIINCSGRGLFGYNTIMQRPRLESIEFGNLKDYAGG